MNNSFTRYNTYPERSSGSRRLADTISSNWISVRENNCGELTQAEDKKYEDTDDIMAEKTMQPVDTAVIEAPVSAAAAARMPEPQNIPAYGCVYHKGVQRLIVAHPGDAATVHFGAHCCLNRIVHEEDEDHVEIMDAGDYEIAYDLHVSAKASAPVVFELRDGNEPLPGGTFAYLLSPGNHDCRGGTMARLQEGDQISLALTSVSVFEASLVSGGVSAMLSIKKLG